MRAFNDVLDFWFSEESRPRWFNSSAAFDEVINRQFGELYRAACDGGLGDWADSAEGALALVITLDQFPRNLFRGQSETYATDKQALSISERAIANSFDQALDDDGRAFLYMPFMHSEDKNMQERSVALFNAAGLAGNIKHAEQHRDIVRRFGRFPHRNAILGRESTEQERAYLSSGDAFHG